jgi:DNA-binding NtrC family response regulator/predicted negative regulator of RcsB-dependent stress response
MEKQFKECSQTIASEIELIESLIQQKKFKEALAQIRDLETQRRIEDFTIEYGLILYLLSAVFQGLGRYREALCESQKAFDILKSTVENKKVAQIHFLRGIVYSDLGDLKRSESEFRDAVADYKRDGDKKGIIHAYNELARIYFIKGEYKKAIEHLTECINYCDETEDKNTKVKLSANLARIHIRAGNWKLAKAYLEASTKAHQESGNKLVFCNGLLSLGYVCYLQRDFKKAKEYYEDALKVIYENNYTREFAIYHEYAGELEFAQGNYEEAKNHYLHYLGIMEEIAPQSDVISQTYRLLAELQIAERQYDEAFFSCEKALRVAISLGERIEIGAIHRALGQIYTAKKQKEKARESFEKSINILEQIGAKFELGKAYLEAGRSDCFDFFDRVHYLRRAKDVFKELDSQYHQGLVDFSISKLFFENGEYEKALLFLNDAEKIFSAIGRSASGGKELSAGSIGKEQKELSSVLSFRKILEKALGKYERTIDPKRRYTFSNIITQNHKMQEILKEAEEIKDSDLTILLEGETGTGKDLLAKIIHYESKRRDKNFVVAQCSAIPESLLENALFGHVRGSYTGATENSVGLFQEAEGGTLYLDEIAEIPLSTQVKLLRAIEEKEITRIGETKPKKVDVRIIASTSRNLTERLSKGLFRKDLYFRLNALSFKLPPLRERKEDIPPLIKYFLSEDGLSEDVSKIVNDPEFIERILGHDWPGNVRELRHEIEKLGALAIVNHRVNSDFFKERMDNLSDQKTRLSLCDELAEFEKKKIIEALQQSGGIKLRAAKILGIPETTLRNKLKKYKIE